MRLALLSTLCVIFTSCFPEGESRLPPSEGGGESVVTVAPTPLAAPLLGGAVLVTSSDAFAVVADADHSALFVVNLADLSLRGQIDLPAASLPNRMAEDAKSNIRVVLRGTGQIATVSITSMSVKSTQYVCPEPRGIAYSPAKQATLVACASGELVTLRSDGTSSSRFIERDLRDVVVRDTDVFVTTFREGKLLKITDDSVLKLTQLPSSNDQRGTVAYRAIATKDGLAIVHQSAQQGEILIGQPVPQPGQPQPIPVGAYGSIVAPNCSTTVPVVRSQVSSFDTRGALTQTVMLSGVLANDLAFDSTRQTLIAATPGSGGIETVGVTQCPVGAPPTTEEPIGVAVTSDGRVVVATRDPAQVRVGSRTVSLGVEPVTDLGRTLFHTAAPAGVACASCHPEAADDAHVWTIGGKSHRTQVLSGQIMSGAPFHWEGNHHSLGSLMIDTFVTRMSAPTPDSSTVDTLGDWLQTIAAPRPHATNVDLLARGAAVFGAAGCGACHSGPRYTDDQTVDVGTGGAFQVPSLRGVANRVPLMHNGCAGSVRERFEPGCGGSAHGLTAGLSADELTALTAFVESL